MYKETLQGCNGNHRDQGGGKREDGDITGSKTSPCMPLEIVYLINYKTI